MPSPPESPSNEESRHVVISTPDMAGAGASKKSKTEDDIISQERYENMQRFRRLAFKGHVHRVSVLFLYFVSTAYGVAAYVWLHHLLLPADWHFMPPDNQTTLQSLLFGTIIGGLASQFANKIFSD